MSTPISVAAALMLGPVQTFAAVGAPALGPEVLEQTNDLQRAVWACENGANFFLQKAWARGVSPRFFLGSADPSAPLGGAAPLVLDASHRLSGYGRLSNAHGWFNVRFACGLRADLRQPLSFRFETLAPIPATAPPSASVSASANPPAGTSSDASASAAASDATDPAERKADTAAARKRWYVTTGDPVVLQHGVKETDDRDFRAQCTKGTETMQVTLSSTLPSLTKDGYLTVSVTDGTHTGLYLARAMVDENLGVAVPVFTATKQDPLLRWLAAAHAAGDTLHINLGGELAFDVPLQGSSTASKIFAAACSE
ncbi:MAG: hypothetical protein ACRYG5_11490 [Janthinobacterium lividum]